MQRPVGSVGVEALPDWQWCSRFDKYCGVSRLRRVGYLSLQRRHA